MGSGAEARSADSADDSADVSRHAPRTLMVRNAVHQTVTRVYEGLRPEEVRNHVRKLRSVGTVAVRLRPSPATYDTTAHDLICARPDVSQ